ncbi:maleylacetoacetate isomerase [Roseomonas xinghualingensis]|uniref:maleylacetoacetate isomerase n=1 Tax=Roseomonas xinghualingensis TaxID=2986475 RepID=UPI0021F0F435|nr:maleylacetoacetate isomerase [Roseomonas sp. SXEYE001]MCV4207239.1 maleylacetoacetate isomerase [Roseomonas sp. SXEYE001]
MRLHGYFRSSAAWRERIALNLKGIPVEHEFRHLRHGRQRTPDYLRLNPQGLVPALETDDGAVLTQSMAICEYLEETHPEPPLLPGPPLNRARIRAFAQVIACDIHPVQNLKVLARLRAMSFPEEEVTGWARWVIQDGLEACEALLEGGEGPFCFGAAPTLADICLIPQLGNALRFGAELGGLTRINAVAHACADHPAFIAAAPERQADAD